MTPTESIEIDLGDGKVRHLRYSLGSMRRLKKQLGGTMMKAETLLNLDEDKLAELLFEGLVEKADLTLDAMADLMEARRIPEFVEKFSLAFSGSLPEKNAQSPATTAIQ